MQVALALLATAALGAPWSKEAVVHSVRQLRRLGGGANSGSQHHTATLHGKLLDAACSW